MIIGLPLQIDSKGPHTRLWGCYAHVLAAMAQDQCKQVLTPDKLLKCIKAAIKKGAILDNNKPSDGSRGVWYRCFVAIPQEFLRFVALDLGGVLTAHREIDRNPSFVSCPTQANYLVLEHQTDSGSHFTLAQIDDTEKGYLEVYDPWPKLARKGIKSFRRWLVR
jgi:hypothetical protein